MRVTSVTKMFSAFEKFTQKHWDSGIHSNFDLPCRHKSLCLMLGLVELEIVDKSKQVCVCVCVCA